MRRPLTPVPLRRSAFLSATERISSVTHLVSSLEYLASESDRLPGGLNNWDIIRRNSSWSPAVGKALDLVPDRRTTRALPAARIGAVLAPLPEAV
jgi:hypothetical protein